MAVLRTPLAERSCSFARLFNAFENVAANYDVKLSSHVASTLVLVLDLVVMSHPMMLLNFTNLLL